MSKFMVFQSRLHSGNEDEAKAIEIVESLESSGLSRRQILTQALLCLGEHPPPETADALAETLKEMIQELETVISKAQRGGAMIANDPEPNNSNKIQVHENIVSGLLAQRRKR